MKAELPRMNAGAATMAPFPATVPHQLRCSLLPSKIDPVQRGDSPPFNRLPRHSNAFEIYFGRPDRSSVEAGGSPLLQRRGKGRTSIHRALAPVVLLSCPVQSFSAASLARTSTKENCCGFSRRGKYRRHWRYNLTHQDWTEPSLPLKQARRTPEWIPMTFVDSEGWNK